MGSIKDVRRMNWVILVTLTMGNPFIVFNKSFEHKDACVNYVSNPAHSDTLAVEIIAVAGFNDPIIDISCVTRRDG